MKRHEIWAAAGGPGYAGKPRPVLILQDHRISDLASITTCGLTSDRADADDLRPFIAPSEENGLRVNSWVMVDKAMTFPRSRLSRRIGQLDWRDSAAVDRTVLLFFGLSD